MVELSKKLLRKTGRANATYELIGEGDKVLLGLSGGKDSMVLAHVLKHMQRVAPFDFEFKAVTIGYGMGETFTKLRAHCEEHGIDYEVVDTKTYELSKEKVRPNSSVCSFCARMRRGALYTYALENGYNKVALGHHLDDAAESFFMNFMNNGALRSLAPKYTAENSLVIVRPFIHSRDRQIRDNAIKNNLTHFDEEGACPAVDTEIKTPHAREAARELLAKLEEENPKLFVSLKSAFENIHTSSFMNKEYLK